MRRFTYTLITVISVVLFGFNDASAFTKGPALEEISTPAVKIVEMSSDTIPLRDRDTDFINNDYYNPFDITPSNVTQEVEYDPESNQYIITERIGEEYFRNPTTMTFGEYLDHRGKEQERQYFSKLAGINSGVKSGSGKIDPMAKIDVKDNLIDRLFGGSEVNIQPQGNIDITTGFDYNKRDDPALLERQRVQGPLFDFDMAIKMNVEGSIGKKLNLGFNYDTQATFDFDRRIKIAYDTEQFSEDDIIKNIEAGNVSMPLNSQLIQGSESLFGIKTELQFGKLFLTLLASQQRSQQEDIQIDGGAVVQEFEVRPDEYDENRHFFLSHYHREKFEEALIDLPYIQSQMGIVRLQVWVEEMTDRNVEQTRTVCAIADLAKSDLANYDNPASIFPPSTAMQETDADGIILPSNDNNRLYRELADDPSTRIQSMTVQSLIGPSYQLRENVDFEKFRARKLSPSEYSFNEQLGFISLNVRLRPNQALAVAYEYNYSYNGDGIYKVGEVTEDANSSSTDQSAEPQPDNVIYLKMLKSSNQIPALPSWDLMMKNVYPLGTGQLGTEDFVFDIFYEDNTDGSLKRFIPEDGIRYLPLLDLFQLDKLNSKLDPQPDGRFDFVPGVTVIPRSGTIIFPVLEPFGSSLDELFADAAPGVDPSFYKYQELYDTTVTGARNFLEKNRFVMAGQFKSSVSSEISLGAFNIPQGSVTVRAGGVTLIEGQDYEIDYGIGRLKIINDAYLQSGTPIRVSFEDQSLFSLQQKNMLGVRADYLYSDNLQFGATFLQLKERPFTEKVNFGDDPINNRIYGLDMNFSKNSEWITKAVDKLPFYSTNVPSSVNFSGEVAALRPGHNNAINLSGEDTGVVSIDDFEGAASAIPLGTQPLEWVLASTPLGREGTDSYRPEAELVDNLEYGANRAKLSWYRIDQVTQSSEDQDDPYTRTILQDDLFDRDLAFDQLPNLFTFDLSYYPEERGPYNFDLPGDGYDNTAGAFFDANENQIKLKEPETRWGGVMRELNNNDFEAANVEYIEFWMMNPFMERRDSGDPDDNETGFLYFNLGNVSEDILKDDVQFFENAIPINDTDVVPIVESVWGDVPIRIPPIIAYDNQEGDKQDQGYDGLNDETERVKFQDYLASFGNEQVLNEDPSGDNFVAFNNPSYNGVNDLTVRYKENNNPQGNRPDNTNLESSNNASALAGDRNPQVEDLNNNRSLETSESYYEYKVELRHDNNNGLAADVGEQFIRERRTVVRANGPNEEWYRFQIPINKGESVNGIEGLRSIQFIRMYMTGFTKPKTLRFAELELVRNQWRRNIPDCFAGPDVPRDFVQFSIDDVGVQENSNKTPFNYVLPEGIKQQTLFSSFSNLRQDEKSLALQINKFPSSGCEASVFKFTNVDLRLYERMQMFVHAEDLSPIDSDGADPIDPGDLFVYLKVGKDFKQNYYEYQIPLVMSDPNQSISSEENIWKDENMFDFPLELLTDLKQRRNLNGIAGEIFAEAVLDENSIPGEIADTVKIIGNPSLGYVKGIEIGVRSKSSPELEFYRSEVWINELRATGLQEQGGYAGLARMDIQMADLGSVTASGGFSTIGFGALNDKLADRQQDTRTNWDVATNLEIGKILPEAWNVSIPFFAQYSKNTIKERWDPYELDLTAEETISSRQATGEEAQEIRDRGQDVTTIKTFNFTNVKKNRGGSKKKTTKRANQGIGKPGAKINTGKAKKEKKRTPKPWDIENFSASYAYTEMNHTDEFYSQDRTKDIRGALDYNYSRKANYIKPFKGVKGKWLKWLSEFNFNPLPQSFNFTTEMRRYKNERQYRLPEVPVYAFDDQRFDWTRQYGLNWDLSKSIKINFNATNTSVVDELRQVGVPRETNAPAGTTDLEAWVSDPSNRMWKDQFGNETDANGQNYSDIVRDNPDYVSDYRWDNITNGGRNRQYQHDLAVTFTAPLKYIPLLDWTTAKASYNAGYSWDAAPLSIQEFGGIIQNNQSRSLNVSLNFTKLYSKSNYLKSIDRKKSNRKTKRKTRGEVKQDDAKGETKDEKDDRSRKKSKRDGPSDIERILIKPLLALRNIKFNYRENLATVVPGFNAGLSPQYLGLTSGFDAPGAAFVLGWQPDISYVDDPNSSSNWLYDAANSGWITDDRLFNGQVLQNRTISWDANIDVEPIRDLKVNVKLNKRYVKDHKENFRNLSDIEGVPDFQQVARQDVGSFEVTYASFQTLFNTNSFELFQTMKANRYLVSRNLANNDIPHELDLGFKEGYGGSASQVIIPSFLAAYTGQDVNNLDYTNGEEVNLEQQIANSSYIPRPNWNLEYKGLSKLSFMKEIFSSIVFKHGYKSTLSVNQYFSDQEFDLEFGQDIPGLPGIKENGNFYSQIEIPQVVIDEGFEPLIGIEIKTKSDMKIDFEYRQTRNLALILETTNLQERKNKEIAFGFGYTFPDVNIKFLTGDKGKKNSRSDRDKKDEDPDKLNNNTNNSRGGRGGRGGSVNNFRGRELTLNVDFALGDDLTVLHELDSDYSAEPTRGARSISFSPSVDYDINENLTLRAFFDYNKQQPKLSSSVDVTSMRGGVTVRFNLN